MCWYQDFWWSGVLVPGLLVEWCAGTRTSGGDVLVPGLLVQS